MISYCQPYQRQYAVSFPPVSSVIEGVRRVRSSFLSSLPLDFGAGLLGAG
jgi:hypothetical protein